jgi:agmatinase
MILNFGGDEVVYSYESSGIIILPVPYDDTSTWIKGADKGPEAILKASVNLEFYDIETNSEAHKNGIHTLEPLEIYDTPEALVYSVYNKTKYLFKEGKFPVILGGNHTVSIGSIKAASEFYDNLSVLQLDAHTDLRSVYEGSGFNHACVMARAKEVAQIVQVGIRSMAYEEVQNSDKNRIFYAHDLFYNKELFNSAIDKMTDNVYVTIDLDVFDPGIMPSTGTPEPGGLGYYEVMHFLKEVVKSRNVVGFDVVELCPSVLNKTPDFMAAKIIYQFLSYKFQEKY